MKNRIKRNLRYICICFLLISGKSAAQELNCTVTVLSPTIQMTNKDIFKNMEVQIREFMNGRHWTNDIFSSNERIDCQIQITISSYNGNDYSGSIQVVSSRPVYGTNYNSTQFSFLDKNFNFNYKQFQVLEYQENSYVNEMTSVLAYYAYIILGYDYNSFSKLGGQQFLLKAQSIVNSAQGSPSAGWSALEKDDRNRYYLISDMLEERAKPFWEAYYKYHRLGLDFMAEDNERALDKINESLTEMNDAKDNITSPVIISLFVKTKSDELIDLFSQAPTVKKSKAHDLLVALDPINTEKYDEKLK